jgi:hypothetical protein
MHHTRACATLTGLAIALACIHSVEGFRLGRPGRSLGRNVDVRASELRTLSGPPKILVCAQVKDKMSDVVEWVEFYRLQGVYQIVVFDDGSSDGLSSLKDLYESQNRTYVRVMNAVWPGGEEGKGANLTRREHANAMKAASYKRCFLGYPEAAWVLFIDVDEYIWSPKYETLSDLLASGEVPTMASTVTVQFMRFGTAQVAKMEQYEIGYGGGKVAMQNPKERVLLMDANIKRGPDQRLGEPEGLIRDSLPVCKTAAVVSECDKCQMACASKSIVRASAVDPELIGVDVQEVTVGISAYLDVSVLRGFHYFLQSKQEIAKKHGAGYYEKPDDMVQGYMAVDAFYNSIEDRSLQNKYSKKLKDSIASLMAVTGTSKV